MIGKQTIHQMTYNESTGQSSSASKNLQIQGRDLIDAAEIGKMSRLKAILLIAGTNPLMDDKQVTDTPAYDETVIDKLVCTTCGATKDAPQATSDAAK